MSTVEYLPMAATAVATSTAAPAPRNDIATLAATALLGAMVLLPLAATAARVLFGLPLSGAIVWTQTLNLWLALFGAWLAARTQRHLGLSSRDGLARWPRLQRVALAYVTTAAVAVTLGLAWAALGLVRAERGGDSLLPGGLPVWVAQCALPLGLGAVALETLRASARSLAQRLGLLVAALVVGALAALDLAGTGSVWPWLLALALALALGAPLFVVMGGAATLLMLEAHVPLAAIPAETYELVASPTLASLPLFTLAGCLLAQGGAGRRLVALFDACFGWLPGGIAIAAILVCAFFTTFTGASGVTILALGGVLLPALVAAGYSRPFAIGLLTASGSIGLLFPPSLAVILYGVIAHVPIDQLFLAAWKPGLLLVALLAGAALVAGHRAGVRRSPFSWSRCRAALRAARCELALPAIVLWGFFGGYLTVLETAAVAAACAFLSEVVLHRDLALAREVPRVFAECATLMGGVLIILGMAMGLMNYLVDAELPQRVTAWVAGSIANPLLFIAALNLLLLAVGCLMEGFSAIMIVVPVIVPVALAFGVDPLHLGVLFLANLELAFLMPPLGMNLFLAAYRFELPLTTVYRLSLPFCALLLAGVLLIAYCPALSTGARPAGGAAAAPASGMDLEALLDDEAPVVPALPTNDNHGEP